MKELTGLDPFVSEDRERLGLGLKAYRIDRAEPAALRVRHRVEARPRDLGQRSIGEKPANAEHRGMRPTGNIKSYKLLPESQANGSAPAHNGSGIRRYRLARVGASRRSALGVDRHERLEQIAGLGEEKPSP